MKFLKVMSLTSVLVCASNGFSSEARRDTVIAIDGEGLHITVIGPKAHQLMGYLAVEVQESGGAKVKKYAGTYEHTGSHRHGDTYALECTDNSLATQCQIHFKDKDADSVFHYLPDFVNQKKHYSLHRDKPYGVITAGSLMEIFTAPVVHVEDDGGDRPWEGGDYKIKEWVSDDELVELSCFKEDDPSAAWSCSVRVSYPNRPRTPLEF